MGGVIAGVWGVLGGYGERGNKKHERGADTNPEKGWELHYGEGFDCTLFVACTPKQATSTFEQLMNNYVWHLSLPIAAVEQYAKPSTAMAYCDCQTILGIM